MTSRPLCWLLVSLFAVSAVSAEAPAAARVRTDWDRPVLALLRSPAVLLMTPEEQLRFREVPDLAGRREFVDRFWARVAPNCLPGTNPVRELLGARAAEAAERFADEGVPGWLTDRGRFWVLAGPPAAEKAAAGGLELVWEWPAAGSEPARQAVFGRERLGWSFRALSSPGATAVTRLPEALAAFTAAWRGKACELTPEQRSEATLLAWRRTLYDLAEKALAGGVPAPARPLEPSWSFYPAEGEAALALLTVALDTPLPAGSRIVALLRAAEGDHAYALGTDDVPFEVRSGGAGPVAQAARALPPGRYGFALATVSDQGEVQPRAVGTQVIARLPVDGLRIASVMMADQLAPADGPAGEVRPFRIGGFTVIPRPARVARSGETVTFVGLVLGVTAQPDLAVTYQLQANLPGRGWIDVGQPDVTPHHGRAVLAKDLAIHPKLPPVEYRLVITVADNAVAGSKATQEVPFRVVRPGQDGPVTTNVAPVSR